jgi:hypothetical protein
MHKKGFYAGTAEISVTPFRDRLRDIKGLFGERKSCPPS